MRLQGEVVWNLFAIAVGVFAYWFITFPVILVLVFGFVQMRRMHRRLDPETSPNVRFLGTPRGCAGVLLIAIGTLVATHFLMRFFFP